MKKVYIYIGIHRVFACINNHRHSDKNCSYKLTHDVNKDLYEARRNNKDDWYSYTCGQFTAAATICMGGKRRPMQGRTQVGAWGC